MIWKVKGATLLEMLEVVEVVEAILCAIRLARRSFLSSAKALPWLQAAPEASCVS